MMRLTSNDDGLKVTTNDILNDINSLPYSEVYAKIESLKLELNTESYLFLHVMLYMYYYRHGEAQSLLEENYQNLSHELKKLLADLYSCSEGNDDRILAIFAELHENFPNTRGLYESISRFVLNNKPLNGQTWIDVCLNRDPDNDKVL